MKTRDGDKRTSPVWCQEIRPSQKAGATEQMGEGSIGGSEGPDQERPECLPLTVFVQRLPALWGQPPREKERVGVDSSRD